MQQDDDAGDFTPEERELAQDTIRDAARVVLRLIAVTGEPGAQRGPAYHAELEEAIDHVLGDLDLSALAAETRETLRARVSLVLSAGSLVGWFLLGAVQNLDGRDRLDVMADLETALERPPG